MLYVWKGKPVENERVVSFWARVDVRGPLECWGWLAGLNGEAGYGAFYVNGESELTHRLALSFFTRTDFKKDEDVLHDCDNPVCCNPFHLRPGTHLQNMQDKIARGRGECKKGEDHPNSRLTWEDVRRIRKLYDPKGGRKQKYNKAKLARMYNVDGRVIYGILKGESWKENSNG